MNEGLLIIIFSYNRAMQLDCLLRSLSRHLKVEKYKVKVIYHLSGEHVEGYNLLRERYKLDERVEFIERGSKTSFLRDKVLMFVKRKKNLERYLKHSYLRRANDNFKRLLESELSASGFEYTMFLTDDGYFFQDVHIPYEVLNEISTNPSQVSYRMYVGHNLTDCPKDLELVNSSLKWNYYDPDLTRHWAYPFSIDATIYNSAAILRIIRPVLYHMPATLEAFVVSYCKSRHFLSIGYSPLESNYVFVCLNRVSDLIGSAYPDILNTEFLNLKFLEGYSIDFEFILPPDSNIIYPQRIILSHTSKPAIVINGERLHSD